jgi:hypothetical protein
MKLFVKPMLALLFLAMLLPFTILKDNRGNTLMSLSDLGLPSISMPKFSMPVFFGSNKITPSSDDDLSGKDIFYKWYDSEGNIQFSTEPPADGIEYTLKGFDPNANVIQSVKIPPKKSAADESTATQVKPRSPEDGVNPYSGDHVKKMIEDTKNIEKLLSQRYKDQESALNQ